jgi:hypothetical protein
MLRKATDLIGYRACASDGEIGNVVKLLFDDETWTVRYFLVYTGRSLSQKQVLLSPIALTGINDEHRQIEVNLKQAHINDAPPFDMGKPVSRQYEIAYYTHYGWPFYWGAGNRWGNDRSPSTLFTAEPENRIASPQGGPLRDTNLKSTADTEGFRVYALDGLAGQVNNFLIDDRSWSIRFLVVHNEQFDALISPYWMSDIGYAEQMIALDIPLDLIRKAPVYDPGKPVRPDYELDLFKHYRRDEDVDAVWVRTRVP